MISQKAWHALELGLKGLLIPIQNMSDAGLRRGYLHRNIYRRMLILEWLKYASSHGVNAEQMATFTAQVQKPGRLDEVFKRLLKVGVRLNAERDPSRLPEEIVEEVEELTGAERIALVLHDEHGERRLVKSLLPQLPFPAMSGKLETQPDIDAFLVEIDPWLEEAVATRQGFIRQLNPKADLIEQRSVLAAPLISQGRLLGVIYCDLRGCFGSFDPEDLNLLGVLANQSAVAVENSDWSATLEQKVTDRTAELKQSNDRLVRPTQGFQRLGCSDGFIIIGCHHQVDLRVRLHHVHHYRIARLHVPGGWQTGNDLHVRVGFEGVQEPTDPFCRMPTRLPFQHANVGFPSHYLGDIFTQCLGAVALAVANHPVHPGREGFDIRVHQHHRDPLVDGLLHQRRRSFLVVGREDDGIHSLNYYILDHFHLTGYI
jgi:hypothetical protein